jgi:hypothetical protein
MLKSASDQATWQPEGVDGIAGGFIKRNGSWYVTAKMTSEDLGQILTQSGLEKLAAADKKGSLDLSLDATDFIQGVGKGVNFVRENAGGVWRDNTPISSETVAAYKFRDQMDSVMPNTREGELRMVKDELFMFLLNGSDLDFYIMDAANDPADPLGSMKRLFDNARVNANFGIGDASVAAAKKLADYIKSKSKPDKKTDRPGFEQYQSYSEKLTDYAESFKDIAPFVDAPKAFAFSTDFFKSGKIAEAMNAARTVFGAFFDLFIPGSNLEMEFVFTPWGPAFKRRQQFLRKLLGRKTSMSDADFAKFAGTDYFEKVTLPEAEGVYTFITTTPPPSQAPPPVTVSSSAMPSVAKQATPVPGVTATSDSYGWAYVLYLLGILTRGEVEQPAVAPPAPTPAPAPPRDPAGEVKSYIEENVFGKPLGEGALFFDFNRDQIKTGIDVNAYYQSVAKAVKVHVDKIKGILAGSNAQPAGGVDDNKYRRWFDVTIISTSDPVGTAAYNAGLAKRREYFTQLKDVIEQVAGPAATDVVPGIYYVYSKPLGESPWSSYPKISETNVQPGVHEFLRFSKAFGDRTTTTGDGVYQNWAREFAEKNISNLENLRESAEIKQIRDQIRRIILEGSGRHE